MLALVSLSTARVGDQVTTTGEPLGVLEFIDAEVMEISDAVAEARPSPRCSPPRCSAASQRGLWR